MSKNKQNAAENAVKMVQAYRKEMNTVRMMRWFTFAVYIVLLVLLARKINIGFVLGSLVIFFLALRFLQTLGAQQFMLLQEVLNVDCDAVKYTKIMELMQQEKSKENAQLIRLCHVNGLYYSGRFEEAAEKLEEFGEEKPSSGMAMLYRTIAFNCRMGVHDLEGANTERQAMQNLLGLMKNKERTMAAQQLMVMDAALALEEEDYDEFVPLQNRLLKEAAVPLQEVTGNYQLALGELARGEDADALEHLEIVVNRGGTTFMAAEAKKLMKEYGLPAHK